MPTRHFFGGRGGKRDGAGSVESSLVGGTTDAILQLQTRLRPLQPLRQVLARGDSSRALLRVVFGYPVNRRRGRSRPRRQMMPAGCFFGRPLKSFSRVATIPWSPYPSRPVGEAGPTLWHGFGSSFSVHPFLSPGVFSEGRHLGRSFPHHTISFVGAGISPPRRLRFSPRPRAPFPFLRTNECPPSPVPRTWQDSWQARRAVRMGVRDGTGEREVETLGPFCAILMAGPFHRVWTGDVVSCHGFSCVCFQRARLPPPCVAWAPSITFLFPSAGTPRPPVSFGQVRSKPLPSLCVYACVCVHVWWWVASLHPDVVLMAGILLRFDPGGFVGVGGGGIEDRCGGRSNPELFPFDPISPPSTPKKQKEGGALDR